MFRHPGNLNLGEFSLMPLCIEWTRIVLRSGLVLLSLILKKRFLGWLDSCGESPHYLMLMHSYILPFGVLPRTLNAFQRPWCFLSQGKLNHSKQDLIFQLTRFEALLFPNLAQTFFHWNLGCDSFHKRLIYCLIKAWLLGSHARNLLNLNTCLLESAQLIG